MSETKTIYQKLADVRVAVQKQCTQKSGVNAYANFRYFELKDFLSAATEELAKEGLIALFNLEPQPLITALGEIVEVATLKITDGKEEIVFSTPIAEAGVKGATPIQNLGSQHTYLKRYLYLNALELSEADTVDAQDQSLNKQTQTQVSTNQPTKEQTQPSTRKPNNNPITENQIKVFKNWGMPVEFYEGLTVSQASEIIKKGKAAALNATTNRN